MKKVKFSESYLLGVKQREEENKRGVELLLKNIRYNILNFGRSIVYSWEEKYIDEAFIQNLGVRVVKVKNKLVLDKPKLVKYYKINHIANTISDYCVIATPIVMMLGILCLPPVTVPNDYFLYLCVASGILVIISTIALFVENITDKKLEELLKTYVRMLGKFDRHYADNLLERGCEVYWDEARQKYVVVDKEV